MRHSPTLIALICLSGICLPFAAAVVYPAAHLAVAESPDAPVAPLPDWGEAIPEDVRSAALAPDQVLDEEPCDWRPALTPLIRPAVAGCRTAREATLAVASRMTELTGIYYDQGRRKPCMNVLEALAEKKVSCTGQSIALVCALRSVGIPARAVGVLTWNHVRGNHTWVEAWFEGQWHMIEFNESDFNTPWVMEAVGMLNPAVLIQRVIARQDGGEHFFPTVWNLRSGLRGVDVTERYLALARDWYAQNGVPADRQKLMVDIYPRSAEPREVVLENEAGEVLARAQLPTKQDDMRRFATLLLPRGGDFYLRAEGSEKRVRVAATTAAVQLIRLR